MTQEVIDLLLRAFPPHVIPLMIQVRLYHYIVSNVLLPLCHLSECYLGQPVQLDEKSDAALDSDDKIQEGLTTKVITTFFGKVNNKYYQTQN